MALVTVTLTVNGLGTCRCPRSPLDCTTGGQLVVFLKDPSQTVDGSGVLVMDIINVTFDSSIFKYTYFLQFDDTLITVPSINQTDFDQWCCYDCATRYVDARENSADCPEVLACLPGFQLAADVGLPETIDQGDTAQFSGGASIATTVGAVDTITIDLQLSTDTVNIAVFGTDGDLFVEGPTLLVPTPYFIGT